MSRNLFHKSSTSEKLVIESDEHECEYKNDLELINRTESNDIDEEEKQVYIKEIINILSEIHICLAHNHKNINENELAKIILEINNRARHQGVENKVLNLVHELIFLNLRKNLPLYHKVPLKTVILIIILTLIFICDIFANMLLSVIYIMGRRYSYSFITFAFHILPSIFITTMLKRFQVLNYTQKWTYVICNLSPVICCFQTIIAANKIASCRKSNDILQQMKYYNDLRDSYGSMNKIKQFAGFLHGAPQLLYQLAIVFHNCRAGICKTNLFFQLFLILTSLLVLIVAIENRFKGQICKKLWLFPTVVARTFSIFILMFKYPSSIITFLIFHWLVTICWWIFKKEQAMNQYSLKERILRSASEAVITTFIPIKFMDTDIHFGLCVIHFLENIISNVIWATTLQKMDNFNYIYALVFAMNVGYFLCGIILKVITSKFTKFSGKLKV